MSYKDMTILTTNVFSFDNSEDWHYKVTAYGDVVQFIYYELGEEKQRFDIPTFAAARMLPKVVEMAELAEQESGM
jgi:hypothetical protein